MFVLVNKIKILLFSYWWSFKVIKFDEILFILKWFQIYFTAYILTNSLRCLWRHKTSRRVWWKSSNTFTENGNCFICWLVGWFLNQYNFHLLINLVWWMISFSWLLKLLSGFCGGIVGTPCDVINVRMQNDIKIAAEKRRKWVIKNKLINLADFESLLLLVIEMYLMVCSK